MIFNSKQQPLHLTFILVSISSLLLGISMFLIGSDKAINNNVSFYHIENGLTPFVANFIAATSFILIAGLSLFSIIQPKAQKVLASLLVIISTFVLLSLFSESRWIASLGGFPAIGSGQGVIKYFALLSIGLYLLIKDTVEHSKLQYLMLFPVVLVLLWIGGMKFTLLEAQGIEPLVASSPLMSWMYQVWDIQTTSNLIGIYDLIALLLLILSIRIKSLLIPAIAMAGAVFVVTQTFLFTWDSALSIETMLTGGGHFLIKDLWFVANLIVFYQLSTNKA